MSTKNKYSIPVPQNLLQRIDRTSSPAHVGNLRNAVDFIVPQNIPILVAALMAAIGNIVIIQILWIQLKDASMTITRTLHKQYAQSVNGVEIGELKISLIIEWLLPLELICKSF